MKKKNVMFSLIVMGNSDPITLGIFTTDTAAKAAAQAFHNAELPKEEREVLEWWEIYVNDVNIPILYAFEKNGGDIRWEITACEVNRVTMPKRR